jgi:hypothetical protein
MVRAPPGFCPGSRRQRFPKQISPPMGFQLSSISPLREVTNTRGAEELVQLRAKIMAKKKRTAAGIATPPLLQKSSANDQDPTCDMLKTLRPLNDLAQTLRTPLEFPSSSASSRQPSQIPTSENISDGEIEVIDVKPAPVVVPFHEVYDVGIESNQNQQLDCNDKPPDVKERYRLRLEELRAKKKLVNAKLLLAKKKRALGGDDIAASSLQHKTQGNARKMLRPLSDSTLLDLTAVRMLNNLLLNVKMIFEPRDKVRYVRSVYQDSSDDESVEEDNVAAQPPPSPPPPVQKPAPVQEAVRNFVKVHCLPNHIKETTKRSRDESKIRSNVSAKKMRIEKVCPVEGCNFRTSCQSDLRCHVKHRHRMFYLVDQVTKWSSGDEGVIQRAKEAAAHKIGNWQFKCPDKHCTGVFPSGEILKLHLKWKREH